MREIKKVLSGVEAFKKEMDELGVEVKVSVSIPIPFSREPSLYQPKPKEGE